MEIEVWRPISEFEGYYEVSNLGNVRNSDGLVLKTQTINSGYLIVHLSIGGARKAKTVHRLVATAFIEKPVGKEFVNHIDGKKINNKATNLEWCTAFENMEHAVTNGLTTQYERTDDNRRATGERISKLMKGVPKTKEHNQKNSDSHKGKAPKCITERKRSDFVTVKCVDTGAVFPTIKDAALAYGINENHLWRYLRKGSKYPDIKYTFIIEKDGSKSSNQ